MKKHSFIATGAVVFTLTVAALPARADDAATLAQLQAQLNALSAQVNALNAKVAAQDATIAAQQATIAKQAAVTPTPVTTTSTQTAAQHWDAKAVASAPPVVSATQTPVKVSMAEQLKIESADGLYSFQPYGRVHFDTVVFDDDKLDRANNASLRRARLGFRGQMGDDLAYRMEMDFANEDANIRDAYLTYSGLGFADIHLGNMKPALGMEQLTSSNDILMAERSSVTNALTRGHILGATLTSGGHDWSLRTGIYNEDASVNNGTNDEALSAEARLTTDLLRDTPDVLHVGGAISWQKPNGNTMTLKAAPAGSGPLSIVSTGAISNVDDMRVYGLEAAAGFGPLLLQGEYMLADVSRSGARDASFDGWYAQAAWLLTGERHPYSGKTGIFGRVKPHHPFSLSQGEWGAFELLARYDTLSLNDADAGINGGGVDQYALGMNWYLRNNLRLMLNYTHVDSDGNAVVANDAPDVYQLRTQWDF